MGEPWLLLETSGRGGRVGLAVGGAIAQAPLDPTRRHNRDLAPAADGLLRAAGLTPKQLHGVMVSVGPGSYTGLRVGVMSAKALAYATGCRLVAVPTFHAIAEQAPAEAQTVDVIADALQGLVYAQRFRRTDAGWEPADELRIEPFETWAERAGDGRVSGPGVDVYEKRIRGSVVPAEARAPGVEALYRVGLRLAPLTTAEVMRLEPLYLRPSSAEEKAARK
jgi:tRNA threonylcarbamoyladenosine biosynthesis protein TsaB